MKAAVFHKAHDLLTIEDVEIDSPIGSEVLLRTVASGVCGSDLHIVDAYVPVQGPMVLGHEAAGVVEAVGPDVSYVKPGDHVVTCPSIWCGECAMCLSDHPYLCDNRQGRPDSAPPRLSQGGKPVAQFTNLSSFAERMLVPERGVLNVDKDLPLETLALIGCGVTTGLGAALRTAKVEAGSTVAVFGVGGVGLSTVQGAHIAGATMIIAVDINEYKLATALELGATHVVDASSSDPVEAIKGLTGGGVDYAFEAIGNKKTAEQAFASIKVAGTAVLIGFFPWDAMLEIPASQFIMEKKLIGSRMGSNKFRLDMPAYIELYKQGRLKLDEMVTRRMPLDEVNEAFRAMKAGEVTRSVLTFGG
ncbi:MAG: Zn-dependent alcohol dehydrogenase [Dehalococcoidia bacterium]